MKPSDQEAPLPCTCGSLPVRETRRKMLGKVQDGGFPVTLGRYICPVCEKAPSWGRCYCVDYGWQENVEVWNRMIKKAVI